MKVVVRKKKEALLNPRPCSSIGDTWEEVEKEIFTPEEIAASDARVAKMAKKLKACRRRSRGK